MLVTRNLKDNDIFQTIHTSSKTYSKPYVKHMLQLSGFPSSLYYYGVSDWYI